jgi:tRNA dimethylallyltransferase
VDNNRVNEDNLPPAIFVMGPTASGKTALGVQLAQHLNGEIISVDSALVYKGMDIGTAKPTEEDRKNIPHHLIDILDPLETFSTGRFREDALQLMEEVTEKGKMPILVGGTMLYFNSLFNGLALLPEADIEVRKKLDEELATQGKQAMHDRLNSVDPASAQRIHPNDPQRVQRALEVYELSGKPMTHFFYEAQQNKIPFKQIKLIVAPENRNLLHEKIAQRFRAMIDTGLVEEVRSLFQRGDLTEKNSAIRAVGYRQVWSFLKGEYGKDEMIEKGIIATRQLAKRQYTWLRREDDAPRYASYDKDLLGKVIYGIESYL